RAGGERRRRAPGLRGAARGGERCARNDIHPVRIDTGENRNPVKNQPRPWLKSLTSSVRLPLVSETGKILRGPWRAVAMPVSPDEASAAAAPSDPGSGEVSGAGRPNLTGNKIMLGFIVRDCAVALGHNPSPEELAGWANHQSDERGQFCLF